jgi:hypothetical protein
MLCRDSGVSPHSLVASPSVVAALSPTPAVLFALALIHLLVSAPAIRSGLVRRPSSCRAWRHRR